jgi:two-component system, sensor histidine kinase
VTDGATGGGLLTGAMSPEERARVVVALDHDARQPQHAIEMGLRNLRLLAAELTELGASAVPNDLALRMQAELASVQAAARQIIDTQQDLIDTIRLEFDDTRPAPRVVHAEELINRAIKTNRVLAANLILHGAPSRLVFFADERWTERIINNLIANAIWHSGGDRILVGARRRGDDIVIEVRDNGRGMTQEKVNRVFEALKMPAFAPAGYSAAKSGLGLYNVRLFTERMGGTVECRSTLGLGTLFRVRLPGPVQRLEPKPLARARNAPSRTRSKVIAILDDDRQGLRATERAFENLGIEVYADTDPLRWLNIVTELARMPDLFLLDFQLRGQDCSLQLDIVRRKWGEANPKVIVVTGHADNPALQKIARTVPVLRKPLSDPKFELLLEILAGTRQLPAAGFL